MMTQPEIALPTIPPIGRSEHYYAHHVHDADRRGDIHAHEAYKVGQYVTLGIDEDLAWEEKLKYFRHALKRHCVPPPLPDDRIWTFYRELAGVVRHYSGAEALRLSSEQDDTYAFRLQHGESRDQIEDDAEIFFDRIIPRNGCPEWFNEEDYEMLKLIRNQWI